MSKEDEVKFDKSCSYRSSEMIESIVDYWVKRYPPYDLFHFESKSHFIRSAIIRMDKFLKESGR